MQSHDIEDINQEIALYRIEHPNRKIRNDWIAGNYIKAKRFRCIGGKLLNIDDCYSQVSYIPEMRFENIDLIRYLFSKISLEDRRILILNALKGYSHEDIARLYGVHRVTITRRLKFIKERLRSFIDW